jgi:hypothetical protein
MLSLAVSPENSCAALTSEQPLAAQMWEWLLYDGWKKYCHIRGPDFLCLANALSALYLQK